MNTQSIDRRFDLHRPTEDVQHVRCDHIRRAVKQAALVIVSMTNSGREQELAVTKLEEALFFAIGAVVRPGDEQMADSQWVDMKCHNAVRDR